MKTLTLITASLLLQVNAWSQNTVDSNFNKFMQQAYSAGEELKQYNRIQQVGNGMVIGGFVATLGGTLAQMAANQKTQKDATQKVDNTGMYVAIAGGSIAFIGGIVTMFSHSHIAKAGQYLQFTPTGVSVNINRSTRKKSYWERH